MDTWANVTSKKNGSRPMVHSPRPPGGQNTYGHSVSDELDSHMEYKPKSQSPQQKGNSIRPKYMPNDRDRGGTSGVQTHTHTPRHDRYSRNYSPHNNPAANLSFRHNQVEEDSSQRSGFKQSYNKPRKQFDDENTFNKYQRRNQFPDRLFSQDSESQVVKSSPDGNFNFSKENDQNSRFKRPGGDEGIWNHKVTATTSSGKAKWKSRRVEQKRKIEEAAQQQESEEEPQTSPPQQQQQQPTSTKGRTWWYLDPQKETQGPFEELEMREWYTEGFFFC